MRKNWHDHGSPLTLPELVFTLAMPRHRFNDSIFHHCPQKALPGSDSRIYSLNGSLYIQYHSLRLNIPCCPTCADSLYRTGLDHCSKDCFNSRGADIREDFADLGFG